HVNAADAFDGQDLLEVVDTLPRFDHGEEQDFFVGSLPVIGTILGSTKRPEAAFAHGWIATRANQRLGFSPGVAHGTDDAHGSGIEHAHDVAGIIPGYAHQRGCLAAALDGLQDRHNVVDVAGAVLHIDGDAIPALRRIDFGGKGIGNCHPTTDAVHAVGDFLF